MLRGPSGTGKTSIARHFENEDYLDYFEADLFFESAEGYKFHSSLLTVAHQWCKASVEKAMLHESPKLIVSNTSTCLWEIKPYLELAQKYDYEVEILRTPGPWDAETLFRRNKHGVPLETIQKQINRYQPHPDESEWTDLTVFE